MGILYKTSLLTESWAFFKSINSWYTSSFYSYFFSSVWWMQNIWSIVDLLRRNPHDDPQYFPLHMELTLTNFVRSWQKWYASIITTICFIALLIERYNDKLLQLVRQFLLSPNKINKFMDLRANCSTPYLKQFCWDLIITLWYVSF